MTVEADARKADAQAIESLHKIKEKENTMTDAIIEFFSSLPGELYVFVISLFPIVELRGAIPVGAAIGLPFYLNYLLAILGNMLPIPFILLFISKFLDLLERFKLTRPLVNWVRRKADKHSSKVIAEQPREAPDMALRDGDAAAQVSTAEARKLNAKENIGMTAEDTDVEENSSLIAEDTAESKDRGVIAKGADATAKKQSSANSQRKMTPAIFTALALFVAVPLPGTGAWTGALITALFNLSKRLSLLSIFIGVMISGVIICLASYGVVGFLSFFL